MCKHLSTDYNTSPVLQVKLDWKILKFSYQINDLAPREHQASSHANINTRRQREHSSKYKSNKISTIFIKSVQTFLTNYCELHGLLLPGRIPGYSRSDIKRGIWTTYHHAMEELNNITSRYLPALLQTVDGAVTIAGNETAIRPVLDVPTNQHSDPAGSSVSSFYQPLSTPTSLTDFSQLNPTAPLTVLNRYRTRGLNLA